MHASAPRHCPLGFPPYLIGRHSVNLRGSSGSSKTKRKKMSYPSKIPQHTFKFLDTNRWQEMIEASRDGFSDPSSERGGNARKDRVATPKGGGTERAPIAGASGTTSSPRDTPHPPLPPGWGAWCGFSAAAKRQEDPSSPKSLASRGFMVRPVAGALQSVRRSGARGASWGRLLMPRDARYDGTRDPAFTRK